MILAEKELEIPDQSFFKYTVHLINNVITNTPVFNLKTILIRYITKRKFQMKLTILNTVTIIIYIYIYIQRNGSDKDLSKFNGKKNTRHSSST